MPKATDELILAVLRDARGKALGVQEISSRAGLHPSARTDLKRALRELVRDHKVEKEAKRFRLPGGPPTTPHAETAPVVAASPATLLAGFRPQPKTLRRGPRRVVGVLRTKAAGFGFVIPLSGSDEDLFLPAGEARQASDGDLVACEVVPGRGGRSAGKLLAVLERRRTVAIGLYRTRGSAAQVEPLGNDFPMPIQVTRTSLARDGQAVRFRLPTGPRDLGVVEAVVGEPGSPGLESLSTAYAAGFSDVFPEDALAEAAALPAEVTLGERQGRVDLTTIPLVTIDGEDARDFDDAVYVEPAAGGDRLIVSIADVSHYVRFGRPLDIEALRRGTSVYLPDRVLPMLPERLSNDLCSLVPGKVRLCLVADMVIDGAGKTISAKIYPAVMRSAARCTYTQVAASLDGLPVELPAIVTDRFPKMASLAERLTAMRRERGSIDFNLPEAKIVLDPQGKVVDVARRPRNAAHRLIEEFMLAANEAVARHFDQAHLPTVYRVHDEPDEERLAEFAALARAHGFEVVPGAEIKPQALNAFLKRLEGHAEERALNNLLLRAMMQALYSADNIGHYGLGAGTYLHFTSPIRRYPDLIVHRLLRDRWEGRGAQPGDEPGELEAVAARCSERERAAMGAEREVDAYYAALLMADHVGEVFEGTIDAAVEAGLFVELGRYMVSGLVRAVELGDDAVLERDKQRWVLPRSGRVFRIGSKLQVSVASVNLARRQIDLTLAEPIASEPSRPPRPLPAADRGGSHGRRRRRG